MQYKYVPCICDIASNIFFFVLSSFHSLYYSVCTLTVCLYKYCFILRTQVNLIRATQMWRTTEMNKDRKASSLIIHNIFSIHFVMRNLILDSAAGRTVAGRSANTIEFSQGMALSLKLTYFTAEMVRVCVSCDFTHLK